MTARLVPLTGPVGAPARACPDDGTMADRTTISRLAAATAGDTGPLLTFYDDATGERTELSGVTLANWVAKTANLLVDGLGLGTGDTAAVLLPAHWQTAAVLLGCWTAGLAVTHDSGTADVAFAAADRLSEADAPDVYGLALLPLAAPLRGTPPGVLDYVVEVRAHGDRYAGPPADPDAPALVGLPRGGALSHAALADRAVQRAAELELTSVDRLLAVDRPDAPLRPVDWLLAPLAARASVVLCRNVADDRLDAVAAAERVTRRLS